MLAPKKPLSEAKRLGSLKSLDVLDTPIEECFERITRLVKVLFQVPIVAISLVDDERQWFKSIQGLDVCETTREVSFCGHTILHDEIFNIENAELDPRFTDNPLVAGDPKIRFYAGYPIHSKGGERIGSICIIDQKPRHFSNAELSALKDFSELVEEELSKTKITYAHHHLIHELDETKRAALIDGLTRLWNREGIEQILFRQLTISKQQQRPFGLAMIDIDFFKQVNDKYGHQVGDAVLREVSKRFLMGCRDNDVVGRWGGEEFLLIINSENQQEVMSVAERIREIICRNPVRFENNQIPVAVSLGVTFFYSHGKSAHAVADNLIETADQALYTSKKCGRNKVSFLEL